MSAASNYLENEVLDHVLGKGTRDFSSPTNLKLALFSGAASDVLIALESGQSAWSQYEITGNAYARQDVTFDEAIGGSATTASDVTFPAATGNYDNTAGSGSTVTCIAVVDGTADECLFYGQLDNSKEILNGDTFQVSAGNLTISLA